MDIKEFAKKLTGREYTHPQFSDEERAEAKENGFLIVYGASDDLIELDGALYDEAGVYEGGFVRIKVQRDEGALSGGFVEDSFGRSDVFSVEAKWCEGVDEDGRIITWTYDTSLAHETFDILEDGEIYCRGLIIQL